MRTQCDPETEILFTGGNRGSGEAVHPAAPSLSRRANSLCSLRSLLFSLLVTASAAQAQEAIEAWVQRYNGPANGYDWAAGMAVDAGGNVYVTGGSSGSRGSGIDTDYVTLAYSSAGVPLWTNRWDGPGSFLRTTTLRVQIPS